jgi:WD40 repeat protein
MLFLFLLLGSITLPGFGEDGPKKAPTDRYGNPLPKRAVMRLGTLRFCQPLPWSLAFSPDGKILASGGADNRIRLWDPDTGKEVGFLEGHTDSVNCVAFSADGKWLASGSQDKELILWDVSSGRLYRRFRGHDAQIERMALSSDGKVLASSCQAGSLRLWDAETGREMRSLPIDKDHRIDAMVFTPDSKYLAFINRSDQGIQLVNVAAAKLIRIFMGHKGHVYSLAFSADGRSLISCGEDHTIRVWDVATGHEQRRYGDEKMDISCLALAPDGKTLTFHNGMVHIWDMAANRNLVPPWKAHPRGVTSITYSPDSKRVAVGGFIIAIHDTATGKRLNPQTESESHVRQIEYAPNGKLLAVWRVDETIELWNTITWQKTATIHPKLDFFMSMAFSPEGRYLTTAERDIKQGIICHWDPQTGRRQAEFPQDRCRIDGLAYSSDGATVSFVNQIPPAAFVRFDAETGKELAKTTDFKSNIHHPKLSSDGRVLAYLTYTHKHTRHFWDTQTRQLLSEFDSVANPAEILAFSPNGRMIATPGAQGVDAKGIAVKPKIVLWETVTGKIRLQFPMNGGVASQLAFSPDGRIVASASSRGETIYLWDTGMGKEVGSFTGHRGWVSSLAFSPDGKTLASGGADTTVLVWDVSDYRSDKKLLEEKLNAEQLAALVRELESENAAQAYRGIVSLASHPDAAVGALKRILKSTSSKEAHLAQLISDLDADDFGVRDKASAELARLGNAASDALRQAAIHPSSAEARSRVNALLSKLKDQGLPTEQLAAVRAIEVLEYIASPEAREVLQELVTGAVEGRVTRDAKAALMRLAGHSPEKGK